MTTNDTDTPTTEVDPDLQEKMIDRVQKLIAKASDPGCTEAESEAFYAKAYALMAQWRIEDTMLRMAGQMDPDDELVKMTVGDMPWNHAKWRTILWSVVAKHNSCIVIADNKRNAEDRYWDETKYKYITKTTRNARIIIVGYQSDISRVVMLASSLDLHMVSKTPRGKGGYYLAQSFYDGFISTVASRMHEAYAKVEAAAETATPGMGLAIINRDEEVKDFVLGAVATQKGRSIKRSTNFDAGQFKRGVAEGNKADIGQTKLNGHGEGIGAG